MRFLYKNAAGIEREVRLTPWEESGLYIEGFCLDALKVKTFLKFRVIKYHDDWATHLRQPYPDPAEIQAHTSKFKSKPQPKEHRTEICFTGFTAALKAELQEKARQHDMHVTDGITVNLKFLVAGPTRGPAKVKKARDKGLLILLEDDFHRLLETGELPDDDN